VGADLHEIPKFRDRLSYVYVEHAAIDRDSNTIAFFRAEHKTQVPIATISLLMLGPGTRISHAAVEMLSRNNVLVAWCGEEAVRMYAFGTGGTHSSARLLRQAALVCDPVKRLQVVRHLYSKRFDDATSSEMSIEQLRGREGQRVREAYRRLADTHGIVWERREYERGSWAWADPPNRALSAANSCLYGICHAAIASMGFSAALGFIHTGKQLSFVYDMADLYKLETAVPVAFAAAAEGPEDIERRVRLTMRDKFREEKLVDRIAEDLLGILGGDDDEVELESYDDDPARPAELWEGD
jgi:CRISPR-associated protein Cas1